MKRYNARFRLELESNQIRREEFQGREHLVIPTIAVQEMILPNTNELLPGDEIEASVQFWNGVPVAIGHPQRNGQPVSAGSREVQEVEVVGQLFDTFFHAPTRQLRGELWIDLELAGDIERGTEVVERFEMAEESGKPVEVSTSYFARIEASTGEIDGVRFEGIQREIRPDHIAILLDDVGACSVDDGCGAPRLNDQKANVRSSARRPTFQGTEETAWSAPSLAQWVAGWVSATGSTRPESVTVEALPSSAKTWIANRTLLGESGADNFRDLAFFPVVNPRTNRLNRRALNAVLGGRGAQANIPAAARTSAQNTARSLLEAQFETASRHPGRCPPGQHEDARGRCVPNTSNDGGSRMDKSLFKKALELFSRAVNAEDGSMDREKTIEALCANTACPFKAERLGEFTDEELKALSETYIKVEGDDAGDGDGGAGDEAAKAEAAKKAADAAAAASSDSAAGGEAAPGGNAAPALTEEDRANLKVLAEVGASRLKEIAADETERRNELIDRIVANKANELGKKELEKIATSSLLSIDRMLAPASYVGLGGPYTNRGDDDAIPAAPPVLLKVNAGKKAAGGEA